MTNVPGTPHKALVLLCEDLADAGSGLDLVEISRRLREADAAVAVETVSALCERPAEVSRAEACGAGRLILGLCNGLSGELEMHRHAREIGLDPLAIESRNLGAYCALVHPAPDATAKATVLLAAAVARSRAFPGSEAGSVVPRFARMSQQVSRRSLFTVPPIRYQPVVSLDGSLCAADVGCRQCADACPVDALAVVDGRIVLDRSRCEGCGVCASVCPREALDLATASRAQVDAEIGALLAASWPEPPAPRALLLVCERNASALETLGDTGASYPPAWLPVTAPCTGAVSAARVLGCLAAGADAVGIIECGGACPHGQAERVAGTVEYCRDLLSALALPPDGVRLLPAAGPALADALNEPLQTDAERATGDIDVAATLSPRQAGRAVLMLAERYDRPSPDPFEHPSAPLAIVAVNTSACTVCGACARACPTEALILHEGADVVTLSFDPTLCTGCGLCAGRCPEAGRQALSVEPITDIEALSRGRVKLYEDRTSRCELCGAPVAPAAMLQRLETLLDGDLNAATLAAITTRCTSCRATGGAGARGSAGGDERRN